MTELLQPFGAPDLFAYGAATALRATVLLLGAFAFAFVLRRASASVRHALWTVTFAGLLALPVLPLVVPTLPLPFAAPGVRTALDGTPPPPVEVRGTGAEARGAGHEGEVRREGDGAATPGGAATSPASADPGGSEARTGSGSAAGEAPTAFAGRDGPPLPPQESGPPIPALIGIAWLAGALVLLGSLVFGIGRALRAAGRALPLRSDGWIRALAAACGAVGLERPVSLRESPEVRTGMAGGILRPVVLVPPEARGWTGSRRRVVLLHEAVHLKRGDPVRKLCAHVAVALYWFHPLVWIAHRRAALAREEACDELVVQLGERPSTYARHLLDLAEPSSLLMPALGRDPNRTDLEKRIMNLLRSSSTPRRTRSAAIVAALGLVWALTVSAASPVDRAGNEGAPVAADTVPAPPPPPARAAPPPPATRSSPPPPTSEAPAPPRAVSPRSPAETSAPPAPPARVRACPGPGGEREGAAGAVVGPTDGGWVVQQVLEGIRLCLRAEGELSFEDDVLDPATLGEGEWLVLAAEGEGVEQRLEIHPGPSGPEHAWFVDGEERPVDATVLEWRDTMLEVLGARVRGARVRGEEARIRGEIARERGAAARLRGELASIRGDEVSLRSEGVEARTREAELRGALAVMRGEEARLRGEAAGVRTEQAAARAEIARATRQFRALENARDATTDADTDARLAAEVVEARAAIEAAEAHLPDPAEVTERVQELERMIETHSAEMAERRTELQGQLEALDTESLVQEAEERVRAHRAATRERVAELHEALEDLDTEGATAELRERLESFGAEERIREIREATNEASRRLLELIEAVR